MKRLAGNWGNTAHAPQIIFICSKKSSYTCCLVLNNGAYVSCRNTYVAEVSCILIWNLTNPKGTYKMYSQKCIQLWNTYNPSSIILRKILLTCTSMFDDSTVCITMFVPTKYADLPRSKQKYHYIIYWLLWRSNARVLMEVRNTVGYTILITARG